MNHEIMIPFNFDTSFIERKLQDDGYNEVINQLIEQAQDQMKSQLPTKGGRYDAWAKKTLPKEIDWASMFNRRFDKWFDNWVAEHGQEIIDEAAVLMAKRASSRKAWKEVLAEYQKEEG